MLTEYQPHKYKLTFDAPCKVYLTCLSNLSLLKNPKINANMTEIYFMATRVETFQAFCERIRDITYETALNMVSSLVYLIQGLEQLKHTFYALDTDHIFVIESCVFLYTGVHYCIPISDTGLVKLYTPFSHKKTIFFSPEIETICVLPATVSKKSIYYSLAKWVSTYLFPYANQDIMQPIMQSKLYWFLLKNKSINVQERNLYWI
jgi:hypothetical protein